MKKFLFLPCKPVVRTTAFAAIFSLCLSSAFAQYDPPANYYSSANGLTGNSLRTALHEIIDDHTKFSYTNVWTILREIDEDPSNSDYVLTIYANQPILKTDQDGSTSASLKWNREHSWPKSYAFNTKSWPAYTDVHHLYAARSNYNSARNNKVYDDGGSTTWSTYGGVSSDNITDSNSWEPWDDVKGDLARSMFYMDVRYQGDKSNEPDLVLIESDNISTGSPNMGRLSTLLAWNIADPVSVREQKRNHMIYTYWQGNRNPFIDDSSYACDIWGGSCSGGSGGGSGTPWINEFHYDDSGSDAYEGVEIAGPAGTDLSGYKILAYNGNGGTVYKTTTLSGSISDQSNGLGTKWFAISGLQNGAPDGLALVDDDGNVIQFLSYEGTLTATNGEADGMTSTNIGVSETSSTSNGDALQLSGTGSEYADFTWDSPTTATRGSINGSQTFVSSGGGSASAPWVNELHYDDYSSDANEGVEIAGPSGTDLSGYKILAYNGNGGAVYKTTNLSGTISNQSNGFGTKWFAISGLQNGGPDGIALVDDASTVLQFLSYEGSFTAVGGDANGMTSTDIGVSETSSTADGHALQLTGSGSEYDDFTWSSPTTATRGSINGSQSF